MARPEKTTDHCNLDEARAKQSHWLTDKLEIFYPMRPVLIDCVNRIFDMLRGTCKLLAIFFWLCGATADAQDDAAWRKHHQLGLDAVRAGDLVTAEQAFREAIETSDHFRDDDPRRASTLNNMGYVLFGRGRLREARSYFEQSLVLRRAILGNGHPAVADSLANLAEIARANNQLGDATELHEQALEIRRRQFPDGHPKIALSFNDLGVVALDRGALDKALSLHLQALEIRERSYGRKHPVTATSIANLAATYHAIGDLEQARALLVEEIGIIESMFSADDLRLADAITNLAQIDLLLARGDDLVSGLEQALSIRTNALGAFHRDTANTQYILAEALLQAGEHRRAAEMAGSALAVENELDNLRPARSIALSNVVARALAAAGDLQEATQAMAAAVQKARTHGSIDEGELAVYLNNWATILYEQGEYVAALGHLTEAIRLEEEVYGLEGQPLVDTLRNFAAVLVGLEETGRAQLAIARADAIEKRHGGD